MNPFRSAEHLSWSTTSFGRVAMALAVASMVMAPGSAGAQRYSSDGQFAANEAPVDAQSQSLATEAYWTPERMAEAQPYPLRYVDLDQAMPLPEKYEPAGEAGWAPGVLPQSKHLPKARIDQIEDGAGVPPLLAAPKHSGNPDTDYPPPFTRWTWFGRYLTFPVSTIVKVFFDQDHDGNGTLSSFVCSASVVNLGGGSVDRLVTAGHCVHNGLNGAGFNGGWSTNVLVCPSYNAGGVNPSRGCWAVPNLATYNGWITSQNSDLDVGCMHANPTGTLFATEIGNMTGALGRAWNLNEEPITAFGYPQGAPFLGHHIIVSASSDWYNVNWGTGPDSKYIGSDQTGGSSGGPWIVGLEHASAGYPDTDGSSATDPLTGGPFSGGFINGVNSHKRVCGGGGCICGGAFALCSQEMGGPAFTNAAGGTEDLFAFCLTGI